MSDYTAWLIEIDEGASINYFQMVDDDDWTFDHNKAMHFGRKQDAQKVIEYYGWTRARVVEHMWPEASKRAKEALSKVAEDTRIDPADLRKPMTI
jgi:hypothetical protein